MDTNNPVNTASNEPVASGEPTPKKSMLPMLVVAGVFLIALAVWMVIKPGSDEAAEPGVTQELSSTTRAAIIAAEKEAIIPAILRTKAALASNNAKTIRDYMAEHANPNEVEQLAALSDDDLLSAAYFVVENFKLVTEESLRSPKTEWNAISESEVQIKIFGTGTEFAVVTASKVDGEWY